MTLTPQAEARIDERIRDLAPLFGAAAARQELRSHVADAAEGLAAGQPAGAGHVDAAFAALGTDADIRATFFPAPARAPVHRLQVGLLALAVAVAAAAIVAEGGGRASCSVQGEGSCEASTNGDALELAVWSVPPLLVLAALFLGPAWAGAVLATAYLVVATARNVDLAIIEGISLAQALLPLAAALTVAVAARQVLVERRTGGRRDA